MSRTFTKLFSSITASTVWCEPDRTRLVWITMLAMADHAGRVHGSIPGLAHIARVPLDDCETALHTFLSPDPYSRTPDFEGRRIEVIDGGWRLLNYAKHRALVDAESVKASKRAYINDRRAKERAQGVDGVDIGRTPYTQEEEEAEADKSKAKAKATVRPVAPRAKPASRFEDFWAVYPNKQGKQKARERWDRDKLDGLADSIIDHVRLMGANDDGWKRGYAPMGSTYLNQARWTDVPRAAPIQSSQQPGKQLSGLMALEEMKHGGLVSQRNHHGHPEIGGPGFGAPAFGGSPAGDGFGLAGSAGQRLALGSGHGRAEDTRGVLDLGPDSYFLAESSADA